MRAQLREGISIANQWLLLRPLNEGAMGSVWEARNVRHGGSVAIKFLSNALAGDSTMRARFEREARAIAKIRSPHVVQIMDLGISEDVPYLVMELLEGEDLRRMLDRETALSLSETASIIEQLGRGLAKVHAAGLVHRDIKPDNVFVIHQSDGGQFVKLLDFGVAKQMDAMQPLTQSEHILGTAHYLSPEQIETPRDVDARCDVWSVGVLAYRMLVGSMPFDAESWPELCKRILVGKFVVASQARSNVPGALDAWFERAIARKRAARFGTIEEATAEFSRIARAHASGVRARGSAKVLAPATKAPSRRRLAIVVASALSAVAVLGALSFVGLRARSGQPVETTSSAARRDSATSRTTSTNDNGAPANTLPARVDHAASAAPADTPLPTAPVSERSVAPPGGLAPLVQTKPSHPGSPDSALRRHGAHRISSQPAAAVPGTHATLPTRTAPATRATSEPAQPAVPKDRGF